MLSGRRQELNPPEGGFRIAAKIEVVDMSNPASPDVLGYWTSNYPGNITDIHFVNNTLYLSAYWGGLWIVDATDFADMNLLNRFDWTEPDSFAMSVRVFPPYVFLARGSTNPDLNESLFRVFRGFLFSVFSVFFFYAFTPLQI
ncbi:MAG: hypothetical protein GY757_51675 [bacterium]|nr:hypothetical protein [bacterium]